MADAQPPYKAVLVELRDIVLTSSFHDIKIPVNAFKSILHCGTTHRYQRGELTPDAFYKHLALDFELPEDDVRETFANVAQTTQVQAAALESLWLVKRAWQGKVKILAMANLSDEEYALARRLPLDWSVFDGVFVSAEMAMRKPEPRSFYHVSRAIAIPLEDLVLVDAEKDSVVVAMSLGIRGLLLSRSSVTTVAQLLANIFGDPVDRAQQFLQDRAGRLDSSIEPGLVLKENFAQLLILEETGDRFASLFPYPCRNTTVILKLFHQGPDLSRGTSSDMELFYWSPSLAEVFPDCRRR